MTEFISGQALDALVKQAGPCTGSALDGLAVGTVTALAAIHAAGVVHRDFKPGNVIVAADGPRVIDFGIARVEDATATMTGRVIGTPSYMAPEQARGAAVGPAADMFAWGCAMMFAASGRPPFGADAVSSVLYRVMTAEPDLSALPGRLRGIVAGCLAKDPAARPTARQVLETLLGAGSAADADLLPRGSRMAAELTATLPTSPRRRPRTPLTAVIVGVATALGVAAGIGAVKLGDRSPESAPTSTSTPAAAPVPAAGGNGTDRPSSGAAPALAGGTWFGTLATRVGAADAAHTYFRLVWLTLGADGTSGSFELPTRLCKGTLSRADRSAGAGSGAGNEVEFLGRIVSDPEGLCPKETRYAVRPAEEGDVTLTIGDPAQWAYNGQLFKQRRAGPDRVPAAFAGRWHGRTPTVQRRDVILDLVANGRGVGGTVSYPAAGCTGRLGVFLYVEAQSKLLLTEDFGERHARCPYNGQYEITAVKGGGLSFRYTTTDPPDRPNASTKTDVPLAKSG